MDITMCQDNKCNEKDTCLRYKGEISYYQSYFTETPRIDDECEYYYEIKNNTPLTEKEEMKQFNDNMLNILEELNNENNRRK